MQEEATAFQKSREVLHLYLTTHQKVTITLLTWVTKPKGLFTPLFHDTLHCKGLPLFEFSIPMYHSFDTHQIRKSYELKNGLVQLPSNNYIPNINSFVFLNVIVKEKSIQLKNYFKYHLCPLPSPWHNSFSSLWSKTFWRRQWQPTPVFLPGESPWTEESGGLQCMRSQRVGHDWATEQAGRPYIIYRFIPQSIIGTPKRRKLYPIIFIALIPNAMHSQEGLNKTFINKFVMKLWFLSNSY